MDRYLTKEIHNLAVSIEDDNANAFLYLSDRLKGAQHYGTLDKEGEAFQIQKRIDVINDKIWNFDLYCKTRNFSLKEKQMVLSALNSSLENESQNLKNMKIQQLLDRQLRTWHSLYRKPGNSDTLKKLTMRLLKSWLIKFT